MNLRPSLIALLILAIGVALAGCGKSKKQIAQEAEQSRLKLEAAAQAAAASAAEADAAEARKAELERQRFRDSKVSELQGKLTQVLKDPASAQFRNVHLNAAMNAICGEINAKNSFGGYVGFREFIVNDGGVFVKPEDCGSLPISEYVSKSAVDATACMKFVLAKGDGEVCR